MGVSVFLWKLNIAEHLSWDTISENQIWISIVNTAISYTALRLDVTGRLIVPTKAIQLDWKPAPLLSSNRKMQRTLTPTQTFHEDI